MLPPFETDEIPPGGRLGSLYSLYTPLRGFLEQEGSLGLCLLLALHRRCPL